MIVVESPVVVLCNLAGKGLAGPFFATGFFAKVGLTMLGERSATFLAGTDFLVALATGLAGAFLTGTDFTAFLATSFFATGLDAGAFFATLFLTATLEAATFLAGAFLATAALAGAFLVRAFFAVGVISIVTSLLSPPEEDHERSPSELPASEKARAKSGELPTPPR